MPIPGFDVNNNIVGKQLSFRSSKLERDLSSDSELIPTEEFIDELGEIIRKYNNRNQEIAEATWGQNDFFINIYPEDADTLAKIIADKLEFKKRDREDIFNSFMDKEAEETDKVAYKELIDNKLKKEIKEVQWEDLIEKEVNVEEKLQKEAPEGIKNIEFSSEKFRQYLSEEIAPDLRESDWKGGHAWLINLGLQRLRHGNYKEAAYAFDGARIGLTKAPIFEVRPSLTSYLNRCLISLRKLCKNHESVNEDISHELYIDIKDKNYAFIPKFLSEPDINDQTYRFSNNIWIANALVMVAATAQAIDPPSISRSEVDPFGTQMTIKNRLFVLKSAERLYNTDNYEDLEEWKEDKEDHLPRLDQINFQEMTPEIVVTQIFSDLGFNIRNYGSNFVEAEEKEIEISYDAFISKEDQKALVKIAQGSELSKKEIEQETEKIDGTGISLFILSSSEYSEKVLELSGQLQNLELYYLNIEDESIRTASSGISNDKEETQKNSQALKRAESLFEEAKNAEDSQTKGKKLEDLMQLIFDNLIPDTEVIETNVRTRVEEIDLVLRNEGKIYPWDTLGSPIKVECKNWSESAGSRVLKVMKVGMDSIGPDCETGILVSWEGISGENNNRNADQLIREFRQDGDKIFVLEKEDLQRIVAGEDVKEIFKEKEDELLTR